MFFKRRVDFHFYQEKQLFFVSINLEEFLIQVLGTLKVTRPSYFVRVQSYLEALCYPHLYFDHKSNM